MTESNNKNENDDDDDDQQHPSENPPIQQQQPPQKQKQRPRRRRRIRRHNRSNNTHNNNNTIPPSIQNNKALQQAISQSLPSSYDFEIPKTLHRIQTLSASHIALQLPEGLLIYACAISDLLRTFGGPTVENVVILNDVTYGACCVDDVVVRKGGLVECDLLVHYGHSCLVPKKSVVRRRRMKDEEEEMEVVEGTDGCEVLYVFVEIEVDWKHAVDCLCETVDVGTRVHVMGTVQFRSAVMEACNLLNQRNYPSTVPQAKPLSPGEVLGCTAPSNLSSPNTTKQDQDQDQQEEVMLFIADGRFHLEAAMIANPNLRALRYDPYAKTLTDEIYQTTKMKSIRLDAIRRAMDPSNELFGIILGSLGRQGNPAILSRIKKLISSRGKKSFVVLLSEILPDKLKCFGEEVDVWVQVACPRLSIDWGHYFFLEEDDNDKNKKKAPVLNSYELCVALGEVEFEEVYPMDYYKMGGGKWSNYHEDNRTRRLEI